MILAGDVGGTKTILALYDRGLQGWDCLKKSVFSSADYSEFIQLLTEFVDDERSAISAVCIGVAGPIVNGDCSTTNLPWVLRRKEIGKVVNTPAVRLLNDLEAVAWGLLAMPRSEFIELNPHAIPVEHEVCAVLAAGTGLGEAIITYNGSGYQVIASEGGHADFAPTDAQQIGLLSYLMKKYNGHVSYERLLSGEGLINIYTYLKDIGIAKADPNLEDKFLTHDPASIIGAAGVEGQDPLCGEALNLFCRIYGAEAGNLALKCLPKGGVYIAGGIAIKILPCLKKSEFLSGFLNKGRSRKVLENLPINLCTNPEAALFGALKYAESHLSQIST